MEELVQLERPTRGVRAELGRVAGASAHRSRFTHQTGLLVLFKQCCQGYSPYQTQIDGLSIWSMSVQHMPPSTKRLVLPLVFFIGLVALGGAAVLSLAPTPRLATPASVGGSFALVDQNGRAVTDRDFLGKPHLVFFGFTQCPDICPTKLFEISEVLRSTGDKSRDLRAFFITVDPERDTPEVLKSYLGSFDERIIGLTGDRAAVDAAVKAYRAYARKVPLKDGDYTLEHTALVYLMDKDGRFVGSFNLDRPPARAAQDLLRYL